MFTPEKRGQKFVPFESVDYADLSVQQLGSIYEGLLEHHFVRESGKLVLKTDKAERKATGTYYTPDYIVKYIVEQTIVPLLQEIELREQVKSFIECGLKMLKQGGRLGEIVPNKFFKTDYGEGVRGLITRDGMLTQIVDFGASQVFP